MDYHLCPSGGVSAKTQAHGTDSKRVLGVPKHSGGAAMNSVGAKYSNG